MASSEHWSRRALRSDRSPNANASLTRDREHLHAVQLPSGLYGVFSERGGRLPYLTRSMRNQWTRFIRIGTLLVLGLWLLLNLAGWSLCGSYERVGVSLRLAGFLLWGVMPCLGPVFLVTPPYTGKGVAKWEAPLALPRLLPLICWLAVLGFMVEVPFNTPGQATSDAEILIYAAPLGLMLWLFLGSVALALLVWGLRGLLRFLFLRR